MGYEIVYLTVEEVEEQASRIINLESTRVSHGVMNFFDLNGKRTLVAKNPEYMENRLPTFKSANIKALAIEEDITDTFGKEAFRRIIESIPETIFTSDIKIYRFTAGSVVVSDNRFFVLLKEFSDNGFIHEEPFENYKYVGEVGEAKSLRFLYVPGIGTCIRYLNIWENPSCTPQPVLNNNNNSLVIKCINKDATFCEFADTEGVASVLDVESSVNEDNYKTFRSWSYPFDEDDENNGPFGYSSYRSQQFTQLSNGLISTSYGKSIKFVVGSGELTYNVAKEDIVRKCVSYLEYAYAAYHK